MNKHGQQLTSSCSWRQQAKKLTLTHSWSSRGHEDARILRVEISVEEVMFPKEWAARNLVSTSTAAQAGKSWHGSNGGRDEWAGNEQTSNCWSRTDRLSRKTMKQWNSNASMKFLLVDIAQFIVQRLPNEVSMKQCPDICFLTVCQVNLLESTMSQVSCSWRCKRETMDHSCATTTLRWESSWSQIWHVRKDNIPLGYQGQHLKSRVRREPERVTTTSPLRMTSALRSVAHNWQHMSLVRSIHCMVKKKRSKWQMKRARWFITPAHQSWSMKQEWEAVHVAEVGVKPNVFEKYGMNFEEAGYAGLNVCSQK